MTIVLRDLSDEPADLDLLDRFYGGLYVAGFPDPNERESLANMRRYLQLRREGWYGPNHYHIILALDGEQPIGASVSDYLALPNCGVIEFLIVEESVRGNGLGKRLHGATLDALDVDARRAGRDGLGAVVIELNDPFRVALRDDNYDPFVRALIWDRWGYGRLCFPYVQPALSRDQEPVECLLLGVKTIAADRREVASEWVCSVLQEFIRWAMRIEKPESDPIFIEMRRFLSTLAVVPVEPLSTYVGRDADNPLWIQPIASPADPNFGRATDLYRRSFPPGPTIIDVRMFEHALGWFADRTDVHYHLWGLATGPTEPIYGMASFFAMRRFGFGGYLAIDPAMRGSGRARLVLRRIEEQIIRDEPEAQRYYIECVPSSDEEAIFRHIGFRPVPVRYVQPPTIDEERFGTEPGPEVTLLRKRLGSDYGCEPLDPTPFLEDLKLWLAEVYRITEPEDSATFRIARSTLGVALAE